MKILIVDDEPLFLDLVVGYLATLGYHDTHPVTSASKALEKLQSRSDTFDCFLLDIRMPGMNGIELCASIRAMPQYATAPIIMITSMTEKSFVDRAFQAGANDYVTKPLDRLDLKARIGMAQSVTAERDNVGRLMQKLQESSQPDHGAIRFEDPRVLSASDRIIALPSMENYLLRLGKLNLFSSAAIGICVENAESIFARTCAEEFLEVMAEVALAILESLGGRDAMLTYAGQGDFCCVLSRIGIGEPSELETLINDRISQNLNVLQGADVTLPVARVGRPKSHGLLSFADPTHLIFASIEDARQRAATYRPARPLRDTGQCYAE